MKKLLLLILLCFHNSVMAWPFSFYEPENVRISKLRDTLSVIHLQQEKLKVKEQELSVERAKAKNKKEELYDDKITIFQNLERKARYEKKIKYLNQSYAEIQATLRKLAVREKVVLKDLEYESRLKVQNSKKIQDDLRKKELVARKLEKKQFRDRLLRDKKLLDNSKKIQDDLRKKELVARKLEKKQFRDRLLRDKKLLDNSKKEKRRLLKQSKEQEARELGTFDYVYTITSWPFSASVPKKHDLINFRLKYQYATKSYSSSNHTQDMSKLIFGEQPIRIQDILLVSKLIKDGKVVGPAGALDSNFYLYYLADEVISFDANFEEWRGSFDYSRKFSNGLTLGLQIPLVHRTHKLKLRTAVSQTNQANLTGNVSNTDNFPDIYNQNFDNFFLDILNDKDIKYHPKNTVSGLGDISIFLNTAIKSKDAEMFVMGIKVMFPTARDRDLHKLWDAEVGNGGFTELSLFTGLLFNYNSSFNPHVFLQTTYSLPAYVDRRVPRRRVYSELENKTGFLSDEVSQGLEGIIFADEVSYKLNTGFDYSDSSIRRFSTQTARIKIHRGPEINFKLGNIFERFIDRRAFLDIFYAFRAKGRDYVSANLDKNRYDASILVQNSFEVAHKVGLSFNYHTNEYLRIEAGGLYTFSGKNVPELFEANAALMWEF